MEDHILKKEINYSYVNIQSTLLGIEQICKARQAHISRTAPRSIYDVLDTSSTTYESLILCSNSRGQEIHKNVFDMSRKLIASKYHIRDILFPYYRGLYCIRDKFTGSESKVKYVSQHELNLYKCVIQGLYFLEGKIKQYDEEKVKSLYSDFEWNILLPELLTCLVLEVISYKEQAMLVELLSRDSVVQLWLSKAQDICAMKYAIEITPIFSDFSPIILISPTVHQLLREYICMILSTILCQIIMIIRSSQSDTNLRSISDFRIIFETETCNQKVEFSINFINTSLGSTTFTIQSEKSEDIVPKYFKEDLEEGRCLILGGDVK